jgi:hypothetical protein
MFHPGAMPKAHVCVRADTMRVITTQVVRVSTQRFVGASGSLPTAALQWTRLSPLAVVPGKELNHGSVICHQGALVAPPGLRGGRPLEHGRLRRLLPWGISWRGRGRRKGAADGAEFRQLEATKSAHVTVIPWWTIYLPMNKWRTKREQTTPRTAPLWY